MTNFDLVQIGLFFLLIIILSPLLGTYLANVFSGKRHATYPLLGWLERGCYRWSGIDYMEEMPWNIYGYNLLIFNIIGFIVLFLILKLQYYLPLNPQGFSAPSWDLAFNITSSFVSNANWQSYAGETTLSYFSQMIGLTVQNFFSAATGLCVLLALIRGIGAHKNPSLGNFWTDLVRTIVYLLLPLSILFAIFLIGEGVVQNFGRYVEIETVEHEQQIIPLGPVASQVAIKQLGSNGGGFFNTNSAHPFENPTGLSNFFQMLAILLIPASLVHMYGTMIQSRKHGWLLFSVMLLLLVAGTVVIFYSESQFNPVLGVSPVLEGKETRFGSSSSLFWTSLTTAATNGSVNAMISSLAPIAGGVAMANQMIGGQIFGGIGVGLCAMVMFSLLTVFLTGLMIGRTPEYHGKKIEQSEMKWVVIAVLAPGAFILTGASITASLPSIHSALGNLGPHGLSEILYAFTSSAINNGSAFAGLNANTPFFNIVLGSVILVGRAIIIYASLAIAGLLSRKQVIPATVGTFSINSSLFLLLLISIILIEGALTYFTAFALGPLIEELLMLRGQGF